MSEKNTKKADKDKEETIESLKQERDEYLDGWKRAKADLINYKKEELSRLEEIVRFSNQEIILELITVLDSFDLAISAVEKEGSVEKGIYMIRNQLEELLKKRGLESMDVGEGEEFDPSVHDAVTTVDTDKAEEDNKVAEQIEKGYLLNGRVVRAAKVKVYKKK